MFSIKIYAFVLRILSHGKTRTWIQILLVLNNLIPITTINKTVSISNLYYSAYQTAYFCHGLKNPSSVTGNFSQYTLLPINKLLVTNCVLWNKHIEKHLSFGPDISPPPFYPLCCTQPLWHVGDDTGDLVVVPVLLLFSLLTSLPQYRVLHRLYALLSLLPAPPGWLSVLCCLRGSWREKLNTKIWWGPRFVLRHSSKARAGAIFCFSQCWGGHHQGKYVSQEFLWKLPCTLNTFFLLKERRAGHLEILGNHSPSQPKSGSWSKK